MSEKLTLESAKCSKLTVDDGAFSMKVSLRGEGSRCRHHRPETAQGNRGDLFQHRD